MSQHLSPAFTEGYNAHLKDPFLKQNPYYQGTVDQAAWETGWITAKLAGGKGIPIDLDINYPANTLDANLLAEEIANDIEAQFDTPYYRWLATLDRRVQEIVLNLDTPVPSGNLNARARFPGELEALLIICSNDGEDFIDLYAQVRRADPKDPNFRELASIVWNIASSVSNYSVNQLKEKIRQNFNDQRD